MLKNLFLSFVLLLLFLPSLKGDVLDDFEVELAKVAQVGNYKNAVNAPESRFAKEYEKSLKNLILLGRKLDRSIYETLPGSSFAFQNLVRDLAALYKFNSEKMEHPENYRRKKSKKGRSSKSYSKKKDLKNVLQDPVPLFKLLLSDIKSLRKIGFTENGFSLSGKSALTGNLLHFRHDLTSFTSFRGQYFKKKTPESFRKEFDRRLYSLSVSARKLQDSLQKYGGGSAASECNISREISIILRSFKSYRELVLEGRRGSGKNTAATHWKEIRFSLQKIESALASLSRSGLEGAASSARPVVVKNKKRVSRYEEFPREALEKELFKKRELIYRSNTLMDGVDKETLRKYLLTLTREEKSLFDRVRKERISNGYSPESATRTAILSIHSRTKISGDKKTLLSLLEKLEREEARLREKKWK